MNRWEIEQKIVIQAMKDLKFRKKLIENPKDIIKEFFKHEKISTFLLEKVNVSVYQEKEDEFHISIPWVRKNNELTQVELENLAAGCDTCYATHQSATGG